MEVRRARSCRRHAALATAGPTHPACLPARAPRRAAGASALRSCGRGRRGRASATCTRSGAASLWRRSRMRARGSVWCATCTRTGARPGGWQARVSCVRRLRWRGGARTFTRQRSRACGSGWPRGAGERRLAARRAAPPPAWPTSRPALPRREPWRSVQDCAILNQCLAEVAKSYPATKFVKIISTGASLEGGARGCRRPPGAAQRCRSPRTQLHARVCPAQPRRRRPGPHVSRQASTPFQATHVAAAPSLQSASRTTPTPTCPRCCCTETQSA